MKESGFSYRRISFLLNIPLSNVKSTVLRTRKAPVKKIYCKTCGKYVKQPKGKKEKTSVVTNVAPSGGMLIKI